MRAVKISISFGMYVNKPIYAEKVEVQFKFQADSECYSIFASNLLMLAILPSIGGDDLARFCQESDELWSLR